MKTKEQTILVFTFLGLSAFALIYRNIAMTIFLLSISVLLFVIFSISIEKEKYKDNINLNKERKNINYSKICVYLLIIIIVLILNYNGFFYKFKIVTEDNILEIIMSDILIVRI